MLTTGLRWRQVKDANNASGESRLERELERGNDIHIALTDATSEFMIALNYESRFGTARDVRNPGAYAGITATKGAGSSAEAEYTGYCERCAERREDW